MKITINKEKMLIIILIALGSLARLYHLEHQSLWLDEIGQVITASSSWHDLFRIVGTHLSPPLDYILLKLFLTFGKADWIVRLPAAMFGIVAIPIFYLLARLLIGKTQAWVPTVFFTLSPMAVAYSQEGRMYSLFLLLSLAGYYLTILWCQKQNWSTAIWLGIINGLLLLAHYFGIFVLTIEIVFVLWRYYFTKDIAINIKQNLLTLGITFLLFIPWVPFLIVQFHHGSHDLAYGLPFLPWYFSVMLSQFSSIGFFNGWYYGFMALFLIGALMAVLRKKRQLVVIASLFVIMLVLLFLITSWARIVTTRNAIFLLPLYLLLVGYGTSHLSELLPISDWLKKITVIGILFIPVIQYHLQPNLYSKPDYKTAAKYIRSQIAESSKVVVLDFIERGCLAYYLEPMSNYVYVRQGYLDNQNTENSWIWLWNAEVGSQLKQNRLNAWLVMTDAQKKAYTPTAGVASKLVKQVGAGDKALFIYSLAAESAAESSKPRTLN